MERNGIEVIVYYVASRNDADITKLIRENQELRIENAELKHTLKVYDDYMEVKNGKPDVRKYGRLESDLD